MRRVCASLVPLLLLLAILSARPADAEVSIGISLSVFPELAVVPGYPVYYAPTVSADYFFYDGLFWVFNVEDGQWYSSAWYSGPWVFVEPVYVPQPILVIPIRYYRVRPVYWGGWAYDAAPRWGQHWGREWESRRAGWERWDRSRAHAAAPLPLYQREYPRDRYPAPSQQLALHNERYTYQGRDPIVQQHRAAIYRRESSGGLRATARAERVEHPQGAGAPARERAQRQAPPPARSPRQEMAQPPAAPRREGPAVERPQPSPAPRRETPGVERPQPQPAPRHEGPAVERVQPERGRRPDMQRAEPAPRVEAPAQQAPHMERPPAPHPPAQHPPAPQQAPEQPREERQQERGPEGHPQEGHR